VTLASKPKRYLSRKVRARAFNRIDALRPRPGEYLADAVKSTSKLILYWGGNIAIPDYRQVWLWRALAMASEVSMG